MLAKEFFNLVLPGEGYLVAATPFPIPNTTKSAWWNFVVEDIPELQVQCAQWTREKKDVFFALASFKEAKVWNETKKDYKTGKLGAWEKRTQANVKLLRSLFLDLDIDPSDTKKYKTQHEALISLQNFITLLGLPTPVVVNSGYGIHAYWPLTVAVPRSVWQPVADKFKNACFVSKLRFDDKVPADAARVLRVPGTTNFKRGAERPVLVLNSAGATPLADLDALLDQYLVGKSVPKPAAKGPTPIPGRAIMPAGVQGNVGATNDPLRGNLVVLECPAMARLVGNRGATASYPMWFNGLSIARYCDDPQAMMRAVSDGHPSYNAAEATEKMNTLTGGPATCASFWATDNDTCEKCPHWTKIKSPSVVGRQRIETPPVVAGFEIPSPPFPYMRNKNKDGDEQVIARMKTEDGEHEEDILVFPYDLYPKRIVEQNDEENEADERSVWVVKKPRTGECEFRMPQTMLSDARKLHAFLLSRGLHINSKHAKATQFYMTAYLNELAKHADRERMYERLGWHDRHSTFVMPNAIYYKDGTSALHTPSKIIEAVTKGAMHPQGSLEVWKKLLTFYKGDVNVAYRVFMYINWGGPLLHMTGIKGVLIAASGETGRGKTTLMQACASTWGDSDLMLVGGGQYGSTMNAMWSNLGTNHSIPLFWDDTTQRNPEEMSDFMIHIPTGKGKERMHGNTHDGKVVTWETFVLSSANTDDVHRVMSAGKDRAPHLMRFVSIPFDEIDRSTEAKLKADVFKRGIRDNYGVAGPIYLPYITQYHDQIQGVVEKHQERFDRLVGASSEERHWTATMASAFVGGLLMHKLELSPFDPRGFDERWMIDLFAMMRDSHKQASSTPVDTLNEFLEAMQPNTLILSPKQASHVDNIVSRPKGALLVRNEVDTETIYVARPAINNYCTEQKANFRRLEAELITAGVIVRKDCYKVLGADTPLATGQTRCWKIDRSVLNKIKGEKK